MTEQRENKMGVMPIGKLIFTMSIPMIISMLVQAVYNVVDSIFVARYSEVALSAVNYSFPAQNLMIGVATGTGVGVNALLSRSLGEKNSERANKVAANGIILAMVGYLVFLLFGLFGARWFIAFQTSDAAIIEAGHAYLSTCCIFAFGIFGEIMFERLMQATGRTVYTLFTQGVGAVVNIIFDPIFIFGYFGFPEMGVKGAAMATVLGQIVAFVMGIILNHFKNKDIKLELKKFKPDLEIIGGIYAIGVPSMIMMCIGSFTTTSVNKILQSFERLGKGIGETAVNVFGVYFKLQSFAFMPIFGLNNGVIPIISYNYGAKRRDRVMRTIRLSVTTIVCIMLAALAVFNLFPETLLGFFKSEGGNFDNMLAIGVPALRTISLSYIFAGICIGFTSVFQALGKGIYATIMSFARQLVVLVPAAYLLSLTDNVDMVWWSYPIAEVMSVAVCAVLFIMLYRKVIKPIGIPGGNFEIEKAEELASAKK
ncbi:MAG: MATE family efflux transporter [Clostridia bacterium]|nr:MATE family efflux transporter [Clostridia bacterium]